MESGERVKKHLIRIKKVTTSIDNVKKKMQKGFKSTEQSRVNSKLLYGVKKTEYRRKRKELQIDKPIADMSQRGKCRTRKNWA